MEYKPIPDRPSLARRSLTGVAAVFLVGLALLAVVTNRQNNSPNTLTKLDAYKESHAVYATLSVSYKNQYSERDGLVGRHLHWIEGNYLAEPYAPTELYVENHDPTKDYEWEVWTVTNDDVYNPDEIYYGHRFRETWTEPCEKLVIVHEYTNTEQGDRWLSNTATGILYVRYVRREMRSLMQEDREQLLDAMALHWKVSDEEGKELYGENYRSMQTLLMYHLQQAGATDCDHYHDGYGFLSQHSALTLLFEQSLQAVNPALALPYWDYVKDMQAFLDAGAGFMGFNNGPLFTADYFGATDGQNHIADGRWADLAVPSVEDIDAANPLLADLPVNQYGALRAPWSNNADPFVVRASEVCGADPVYSDGAASCDAVAQLQEVTDLEEWLSKVSYGPHGPVHIMAGGMLQCQGAWDKLYALGWDDATVNKYKGFHFALHKNAFRNELLNCDDGCYCPKFAAYQKDETALNTFLSTIGIGDKVFSAWTVPQKQAVADAVCNSGAVNGDNLQASSSFTPEFWPIHGTVERMYQARMLNGADDWDWENSASTSWMPSQQECAGHSATDKVLLMGPASSSTEADTLLIQGEAQVFTNREILEMLSPDSTDLPYIYDSLVFDACSGYDSLDLKYSW